MPSLSHICQELKETRTKRQVDMSTIEGQSIEDLNNSLFESLQELREQTTEQTTLLRQETESLYLKKVGPPWPHHLLMMLCQFANRNVSIHLLFALSFLTA